jgi:outer membrane protein assembly factor BamB
MRKKWIVSLLLVVAGSASAGDADVRSFIARSGSPGGVVVHVNATDITRTVKAAEKGSFLVHGLYTNDALLNKTRAAILAGGLGGKVTVSYQSGAQLPFVDNSVNLLVVEPGPKFDRAEILRVLTPRGQALYLGQTLSKPVPVTIDDWTHNLYDAGNNAVSKDMEAGSPRNLQWTADPQYCRSHDANNSFQAMVSCAGRIFYLMDEGAAAFLSLPSKWFLTARDGFNGKVLWKKKLPQPLVVHLDHLKSGMGNLAHRLVASEERVYVTLGFNAPVSALDSRTGREAWVSKASANAEELILYEGTLYCIINLDERSQSKHEFMSMQHWNRLRANEIPRKVLALDAATGKPLWEHRPEKTILPLSMTVAGDSLYLHDGTSIVAFNRKNGKTAWTSEPIAYWREMGLHSGVNLVHYDGVLLFSCTQDHRQYPAGKRDNTMCGLDAKSGKVLWKGANRQFTQYFSAVDLMVADGLVWSAPLFNALSTGKYMGIDPKTGKVVRDFDPDPGAAMAHHRCHRNRGTERYLFTGRTGVDVFDVRSGQWMHDYWARGTCRYGMMPANGMLYVPPNSCACYSGTLIRGFNAMTADAPSRRLPERLPDRGRFAKGPAFDSLATRHSPPATSSAWPTYRGAPSRHGMAASPMDDTYEPAWKAALGGRLTQPVIAGGKVVVSSVESHTLYALDERTGEVVWRFLAGGRINSAPTLWNGRVLFGCNDGKVYCLDLNSGEVAWTFRAAPAERRLVARETLESAWPLNGSVLLLPDKASGRTRLYCVAGRSVFLDGGLRMLVLDAATGEKLSESVMDRIDPETGEYLLDGHEWPPDSPTTIPDMLSLANGKIYMGQQPFGLDGKRESIHYPSRGEYKVFESGKGKRKQDTSRDHLFATTGLLDDQQWHRGAWYFGRDALGSCWSVNVPSFASPSGYLLVLDDENVYGYGREFFVEGTRHTTHLFKCDKYPELAPASRLEGKKIELRRKNWGTTPRWDWSERSDVYVRAMLVAPNKDPKQPHLLFASGAPEVVDEYDAMSLIQKAQRDWSTLDPVYKKEKAVAGKLGAKLIVISTEDGKRLSETTLDHPPVFDGMSAANGRLFIADMNGDVACLSPIYEGTTDKR